MKIKDKPASSLSPFLRDTPPFLFTLFFAALGWSVSHYITSIESSPTIAYEFKTIPANGDRFNRRLVITNLSSKVLFESLVFSVELEKGKLENDDVGTLVATPPASVISGKVTANDGAVQINIERLHPGWIISLELRSQRETTPVLIMKGMGARNGKAIRLIENGAEVFILKNKVMIFIVFFGVWFLVILKVIFGVKISAKVPVHH